MQRTYYCTLLRVIATVTNILTNVFTYGYALSDIFSEILSEYFPGIPSDNLTGKIKHF